MGQSNKSNLLPGSFGKVVRCIFEEPVPVIDMRSAARFDASSLSHMFSMGCLFSSVWLKLDGFHWLQVGSVVLCQCIFFKYQKDTYVQQRPSAPRYELLRRFQEPVARALGLFLEAVFSFLEVNPYTPKPFSLPLPRPQHRTWLSTLPMLPSVGVFHWAEKQEAPTPAGVGHSGSHLRLTS